MTISLTDQTSMDQFGALVEIIGFKPRRHGNSPPMAQLKSMSQTNPISNNANGFPQNKGVPPMPDFLVFDLDDIFYTQKISTGTDPESLFPFTNSSFPANEDLSPSGIPDFLHPEPTSEPGLHNGSNVGDLLPGFGISTPTYDRRSDVKVSQPSSSPVDDPFSVPEPPADASSPFTESDCLQPNAADVPASSTSLLKDFISLFEDDVYTSGAFTDRNGESDGQRSSRLNSHMRIHERMANALAEKRQRDVQILQEQEARSRLGETLDNKIRRWASGKEGDLRALLSSLQNVLWPQSGWQMASDLVESKTVKKVYNRAIVYLHPDKAAQQGFSPEEKYIAEKVFYVLMEAYKVFQAQELR